LTSGQGNNVDDQRNITLADDYELIGKVVKPHGIRGELKVYAFSESPDNFKLYKRLVLQKPGVDTIETYSLVKSRAQGKLAVVQLQGVDTRNKAEALQGSEIWLDRADLPGLKPGEYYWHQFVGLHVVPDTGKVLGTISGLFTTKAHDVMVIAGAKQEYMVPVKDEIIRQVDTKAGKIIIAPPPGLLELNE
jgi:16S rRNA processing protein RimM